VKIYLHYEDELIKITEYLGQNRQNRLLVTLKQAPTFWNKYKAYRKAHKKFPGFKKGNAYYNDIPPWFEMTPKRPSF